MYDMADSFLRQYEMGFVDGRASGAMCSYNLIGWEFKNQITRLSIQQTEMQLGLLVDKTRSVGRTKNGRVAVGCCSDVTSIGNVPNCASPALLNGQVTRHSCCTISVIDYLITTS